MGTVYGVNWNFSVMVMVIVMVMDVVLVGSCWCKAVVMVRMMLELVMQGTYVFNFQASNLYIINVRCKLSVRAMVQCYSIPIISVTAFYTNTHDLLSSIMIYEPLPKYIFLFLIYLNHSTMR